jgi:hypothetical protein
LPRDSPADSLAEAAFAEAHRLSPGFTPVSYHMVEIAARKGDLEAAHEHLAILRAAQADPYLLGTAELLVRCVEQTPSGVDWIAAVRERPQQVLSVGYALAPGGYQIDCSRAAFEAIWQHELLRDRGGGNRHFNALIGLQSVLFAEQRIDDLVALLEDARSTYPNHIGMLYILDALAGAPLLQEARETADQIREAFEAGSANSRVLWFLGIWEAGRGDPETAQRVADTLAARAARAEEGEDRRLARLWAESIAARAALARGDSTEALRLLEAIVPSGTDRAIAWIPWESVAGERLALAELLLANGRPDEALEVAQNFDAPAPVIYLLYLPRSLSLRMRIAQAMGDRELESEMRDRLVALGFDESASR